MSVYLEEKGYIQGDFYSDDYSHVAFEEAMRLPPKEAKKKASQLYVQADELIATARTVQENRRGYELLSRADGYWIAGNPECHYFRSYKETMEEKARDKERHAQAP